MAKAKVVKDTVVETEGEQISSTSYRRKADIDRNTMIPCMSVVPVGTLTYVSQRTGAQWTWEQYGDVQDVELGELQAMLSSRPRFIREPWVLILDDEIVNYLNLKDLYAKIIKPEEVDSFFKLSDKKIAERLEKAPMGVKEQIILVAKKMVADGTLTVGKQRAIEESTGAKLSVES